MVVRHFVEKKLCWFSDTVDSDYCIDFVRGTNKSLVLSGDSEHGFKMMPGFGKFVKELLERGEQKEKRWQWKVGESRDWGNRRVLVGGLVKRES